MPLLPYLDIETASPETQEVLGGVPPVTIINMMANAETCLKSILRMGTAIATGLALDQKLNKLATMHAMRLESGTYVWHHHLTTGPRAGITPEQIAALQAGNLGADCFSEVEKAVLHFTTEYVELAAATPETLTKLQQHLSAREIVELMMGVSYYMMIARIAATTQTDIDDEPDPAHLAKMRAKI